MSELNELSRKTLKSYVSKANKDFKKNVKIDDHDTIHTSNPRKYMKRSEMIDVAKDKLQEESMNEQTLELINAIESGKSTAIETSFNEIMANKLVSAIDNRRQEIASGLFDMQEETVEEGVVPGSVKKDAKGNVTDFTTEPSETTSQMDYHKNAEQKWKKQGEHGIAAAHRKSFHELAMGANRAHVKMVAAKKAEAK